MGARQAGSIALAAEQRCTPGLANTTTRAGRLSTGSARQTGFRQRGPLHRHHDGVRPDHSGATGGRENGSGLWTATQVMRVLERIG
jgi:hypothetical protein